MQVFALRSMAIGAAFHRAYPCARQQAFLEAHELAVQHLGGVYRCLRYDNLGSAVKKIVRGHRREETVRFIAFRSHWGERAEHPVAVDMELATGSAPRAPELRRIGQPGRELGAVDEPTRGCHDMLCSVGHTYVTRRPQKLIGPFGHARLIRAETISRSAAPAV